MNPEIQEILPKAVEAVGGLYLGDVLVRHLKNQSPEQRDQYWRETAQEFGPFSEKITALRQALNNADEVKKRSPGLDNVMGTNFIFVGDPTARELLTDLLIARTIISPGYMDSNMEVIQEAEAMALELGSSNGLREEAMKSVNLDKVVGAVLSGSLKLTRQTQLEKK